MSKEEYLTALHIDSQQFQQLLTDYWKSYSDYTHWQFWMVLFLFIAPLVFLYFFIDRKRIFEVFFYGYTVNMLWTFIDTMLLRKGLFIHNYFLIPSLPSATNMTTSLLPVVFLFVYQYCTNRQRNFYLYTIIVSAIIAFGFATIEEKVGFVSFYGSMNQVYIFLIDIGICFTSYWFTIFFLRMKENAFANK
ncbi:hypothetical protein [Cytobacillus sp. FSL K6-0265]|uniref:hypothetical protein n=1 Tax=Cytobacillus sp. FSL K6-0265 TaxID=2921448 RepID=UPI0030F74002